MQGSRLNKSNLQQQCNICRFYMKHHLTGPCELQTVTVIICSLPTELLPLVCNCGRYKQSRRAGTACQLSISALMTPVQWLCPPGRAGPDRAPPRTGAGLDPHLHKHTDNLWSRGRSAATATTRPSIISQLLWLRVLPCVC